MARPFTHPLASCSVAGAMVSGARCTAPDVTSSQGETMKHHSRLLATALALAAVAMFASAAAAGASARPHGVSRAAPVLRMSHPAPAGVRPRTVGTVPLRVPDPGAYAAQKAAANAAVTRTAGRPARGTRVLAPTIVRNWAGQRDTA